MEGSSREGMHSHGLLLLEVVGKEGRPDEGPLVLPLLLSSKNRTPHAWRVASPSPTASSSQAPCKPVPACNIFPSRDCHTVSRHDCPRHVPYRFLPFAKLCWRLSFSLDSLNCGLRTTSLLVRGTDKLTTEHGQSDPEDIRRTSPMACLYHGPDG